MQAEMAQSSDAAKLAARSKMRRKLQVNAETIAPRAKQTTKRRTLIDKKDAVLAGCVEEGVNGVELEMGGEWRRECVRGVLSRPKKGPAQSEQQVAYLSCALRPLESSTHHAPTGAPAFEVVGRDMGNGRTFPLPLLLATAPSHVTMGLHCTPHA